jgi:hypothetical protein
MFNLPGFPFGRECRGRGDFACPRCAADLDQQEDKEETSDEEDSDA